MSKIRLSFLGDILCKAPETKYAEQGNDQYDYHSSFDDSIIRYLSHSDYTIGNLETPLAGKHCNYSNSTSVFNTPKQFASCIKNIGVNLLTTANNHALDRGIYGLHKTIDTLDELGIEHLGTYKSPHENKSFIVKNFNGIRISFLAYTYGMNTEWLNNPLYPEENYYINYFRAPNDHYFTFHDNSKHRITLKRFIKNIIPPILIRPQKLNWNDCGSLEDLHDEKNKYLLETMYNDISNAHSQSDITIMCLHIGGQYNSKVGKYTEAVVHQCIKNGCDIVICNHPHCVLSSFLSNSKFVAYSLGNFYNTPYFGFYVDSVLSEYSVIVSVEYDTSSHQLLDIIFSITKCSRDGLHTTVAMVYDIYSSLFDNHEKQRLKLDTMHVIERFIGKKLSINQFTMQHEYIYKNFII